MTRPRPRTLRSSSDVLEAIAPAAAELDYLYRAGDIDEIRLSRRGPLRSHQPGSRRHGPGPGLPREPETEPGHELRVGTQDHQPVRLKLRPNDRPPAVKNVEGRARLEDPPETADARSDAWSAVEDAAHQPENVGRYLKEVEELARRAPADLAVTCAYGQILEDRHRHREARDVYQHTVDLGTRALPEKFQDVVDRMSEQGRGLLTALAELARYEGERGSRRRAIELLETLVLWNEDTRNDGRLRLGSEYLRAGRLDQALPILEASRREYPPLEYELGMLHIIRHEWAPAAAGILRGVAENQYVAEIALGATKLNSIAGHDRGFGRNREAARWHMARYGQVWREDNGARAFLRWVSTHPDGGYKVGWNWRALIGTVAIHDTRISARGSSGWQEKIWWRKPKYHSSNATCLRTSSETGHEDAGAEECTLRNSTTRIAAAPAPQATEQYAP